MATTTCELCNCPLTILKTMFGRPEPRAKCARCADEGALSWKPEKPVRVVEGAQIKKPKSKAKKSSAHGSLH